MEITMRVEATIEVAGLCKRSGPTVALDGLPFTALPLAAAGGLGTAWPGPGVAGEGIGVCGGELPDAVEEGSDHQEDGSVDDGLCFEAAGKLADLCW